MNKLIEMGGKFHKEGFGAKGRLIVHSRDYFNFVTMEIITSELVSTRKAL